MCEEHYWELVCEEEEGFHFKRTERLDVPGGWLYRFEAVVTITEEANQHSVAMQFVPTPKLKVKVKKKRR